MATPVKQFYTEASSTLRTATGGADCRWCNL